MAELALGLWALYYALALGTREFLHRRRTGASGLVVLRRPAGGRGGAGEALELVALALGLIGPALAAGGTVEPVAALEVEPLQWLGVAAFVLGLGAIVSAQHAMGDGWRIGIDRSEQTALVTGGPFRLVRNPIFSALVLVMAGAACIVPSLFSIAGLVAMGLSVEMQVRFGEEPHLRSVHGKAYAGYASRVGRFVPGVGRSGRG